MKFCSARFSLAQSLVALVVSLSLLLSAPILAFAAPAKSRSAVSSKPTPSQINGTQQELQLTSATAIASAGGVLLHWTTNSNADNVGFNVYRVKAGERTLVNRRMIPGAMLGPGPATLMRAGYSYSWFDSAGSVGSTYVIESIGVDGNAKTHQTLSAVAGPALSGTQLAPESLSATSATDDTGSLEKSFPAAQGQLNSPQGTIQEQWAIAGQTGLKIGIKKDGWYRVTQPQMVAAGFNPTVDIRNLRLFVDANEVAILTNQITGPFRGGDYIEFYGQGIDVPGTDTRTYYLIAGTIPGKRVTGDIQLDSPPDDPPGPSVSPSPTSTPQPSPVVTPTAVPVTTPVLRDPIFSSDRVNVSVNLSWIMNTNPKADLIGQSILLDRPDEMLNRTATATSSASQVQPDYSQAGAELPTPGKGSERAAQSDPSASGNLTRSSKPLHDDLIAAHGTTSSEANAGSPARPTAAGSSRSPTTPARRMAGKSRKATAGRKKVRRKLRHQRRPERNHAFAGNGQAASNFDSTLQLEDRFNHYPNLLNGDDENFFGSVISSQPVTTTLALSNADLAAASPATIEVALQGLLNVSTGASHQVRVDLNGTTLGVLNFGPLDHPVAFYSVPAAQLLSGANTLTFTKLSTGENCFVDYVKVTYPHLYKADAGSLRFSLRGSQTRAVDGFATPLVRLIDYTDPLGVKVFRPSSQASGGGFAITVPLSEPFSKEQRLLLAIPEGQVEQPASLTLNQPSSLNLNSNAADLLVITYRDFIPSFSANVSPINTSWLAQRQTQGHSVSVVDVADVFDEFGYGVHGPQAIKIFLQHAFTHWATPPHYVIFAGDASFDPRDYTGLGPGLDFVPTKLVDATYNETCSDDWLADFDNDGVADIPVGRLPIGTVADANLIISKIVNFSPANVPQDALLVADQDDQFHSFQFVEANDAIQAQLTGSVTVQRVNRCDPATASCAPNTVPNGVAKTDILAALNSGRAVVNYSGHGSIDVWTGVSILTAQEARARTNGNKLSFVVVMDCLNGYYHAPNLESMAEAFLRAPAGGAVAAFASSGLTIAQGQHVMSEELYHQLYGSPQSPPLGDAIKIAKTATFDIDVKRTWIFFGDPSMKIR